MIIQHNIMALNSYNRLSSNNSAVSKNIEKLSSGFKINRAGDDAAGLAISEKMRAQVTGLTRATQNAQDGISLVQTAEGNLTEVHSMLNRMVDLATQSSNGTYDVNVDRKNLQLEIQSLKDEIDRIAETSNFNGIKLLDGSLGGGGTTGAKGAADVSIDSLIGNMLKDVAATKGTSTMTGLATAVMTADENATYEFTYLDAAGKNQSVKVEIMGSSTAGNMKYKVNGSDVITSGVAGTTSGAHTQIQQADVIREALAGTEIGSLFDIDAKGSANIVLTAKTAGPTQAKVLLVERKVDNATPATSLAVTNVKGVAQFHQLALGATFGLYDGTAGSEKNIITVNGKKFAFVSDTTDPTKFSPDVTTVALSTAGGANPINDDIAALVVKINEAFGAGTAEVDATTDTTINFRPVEGGKAATGKGLSLQIGDTADQRVTVAIDNMGVAALGLNAVDVSEEASATASMQVIKDAINTVSTQRAKLGAVQNRLEHTVNNLTTTAENMTAAESRIRDTNMAQEMMQFTKNNVLSQAAQAMLAQANQQPQQVLQLLR